MDIRTYKIYTNGNKDITNKSAEYIQHLYDTGRAILIDCTIYRTVNSNVPNLGGCYTTTEHTTEYSKHSGHVLHRAYINKVCDCINHRDKERKWEHYNNDIKSATAYYKDKPDELQKAIERIDAVWDFMGGQGTYKVRQTIGTPTEYKNVRKMEGLALGNTANI